MNRLRGSRAQTTYQLVVEEPNADPRLPPLPPSTILLIGAGEDNSFTAGCDPEPFRMPIEAEYSMNKDGEPQCKKHKKANCGSCFTFKKQILKLTKEGQKRAKTDARNNPVSNLLV
ncbi:hypothetical protein NBRC10512_004158 [Rhodotorula toruloides]|uniref:Uncharacterized protein n=1 Tax=Rhodotorula toruloides (strain NP11) TaxID=1130832 RepID=M7XD67_RHOT1|nr:uncharacterized protein RHTO_06683 [Rhodotorula toruloides NP11]EMS18103.1 hypothetical protein RHTO_06683 [Rhodotorula toruloides NP11]